MRKIAVTQRLVQAAEYPETRDALDLRWGELFRELEVLPVLLPSGCDFLPYFGELQIDGIVLTGGNDLSRCSQSPLSALRDDFEKRLLAHAVAERIPVLGVCRGMQLIGDYFGGTVEPVQGHVATRHAIVAEGASRFAPLLRQLEEVNSYHGYAITAMPASVIVAARSGDGVIEAFEHRELPIFAQMWHSERETPFAAAELALLRRALRITE